MPDVQSFDNFELFQQYNPNMRNYGNPMMNMLMMHMFGQNYMPASDNGQSMYYSELQKQRSLDMLQAGHQGFANNMLFQRMGISGSPLSSTLAHMFGSPDSLISRGLSPLIGGNPMAASQQLYAGLSGANIMGNFNMSPEGVSVREVEEIMQGLADSFYKQQKYEGPGGAREQIDKRVRDRIVSQVKRGEPGLEALKEMGINIPAGLKNNFFDSSGAVTPEAQRYLQDYKITAAGEGEEETEEGRNLSKRILEKRMRKGGVLSGLDNILKNSSEKTQKAIDEAVGKLIEEQYGDAAKEIKKKVAKKDGGYDVDKLREETEKAFELDPVEKDRVQSEVSRDLKKKVIGFNFENSRGFKIEDFTSAFVKSAELRMLGDDKTRTPAQAMQEFTKNAGGALSAARSLFGSDKSGGQLAQIISNTLGTSAVDLSSKEGSAEIEKLLRRVKATASVAGVSIKAMLGIIDATQQLAKSSPQLQQMNSAAAAELATKAVRDAANMGRSMTSEEFRAAGGSQGLATKQVQAGLEYAQSGKGVGSAAWLAAAKAKGPEKYRQVKEYLATGEANPAEIAKILDVSVAEANRIGKNSYLAEVAMKDKDIATTVTTELQQAGTIKSVFNDMERRGLSKKDLVDEYTRAKAANQDVSQALTTKLADAYDADELRVVMGTYGKTIIKQLREETQSPEEKARLDRLIEKRAREDTELERKYGGRTSPIITQVTSALMEGKSVEDTVQKMTDIFAVRKEQSPEMQKSMQRAQDAGSRLIENLSRQGKEAMSQEDLIRAGAGEDLSAIAQSQKQELQERYRSSGGTDTEAKRILEQMGDAKVTGQEVLESSKELQKFGGSAKEARKIYTNLKGKKDLSASEKKLLNALETAQKLNILESEKAYEQYKSGDLQGATAGVLTTVAEQAAESQKAEKKQNIYKEIEERAMGVTSEGDKKTVEGIKEKYTDKQGKLNVRKALEDFGDVAKKSDFFYEDKIDSEGKAIKDEQGNAVRQLKKEYRNTEVGEMLTDAANRLSDVSLEQTDKKTQQKDPQQDLITAFEGLQKVISSGGGIGEHLKNLVTTIGQLKISGP